MGYCRRLILLCTLGAALLTGPASAQTQPPLDPIEVTPETENTVCLDCHGVEGFATPVGETGEGLKRELSIQAAGFHASVHGRQLCVACHTDISRVPHRENTEREVDCVQCHVDLAARGTAGPADLNQLERIEDVVTEIRHFMESRHAAPNKDDPTRPNATCVDCHNAHYIFPAGSGGRERFRLETPQVCGRCHEKERAAYGGSVHGIAVGRFESAEAAVCADCHTAHAISSVKADPMRVVITENCGTCHEEAYDSYTSTYHGQVSQLGYAHTAKCFDCHEHHTTRDIDDPVSKVHADNRLKTCHECHEGAPAKFAQFHPHGTTHDFEKYPYMWIASKFMILLLAGVFAFFWTHSFLWFRAEWRDLRAARRAGTADRPHIRIDADGLPAAVRSAIDQGRTHVRRFSWPWRLAHLILALAVMVLVLTGTAVLYADSIWAPAVIDAIGGPKVAAIIHRVCAVTFAAIFFGHIAYTAYNILIRKRGTFRWFGPYSLLPTWQDWHDVKAMFRWFFNKGPQPTFDHWTYFEKFDYWAPFWGMFIIGVSGVMLWFPEVVAIWLPGWVFNVATIVHGEEAFLAAVFLFTVHYFNCHFRPDKLPQDISMFTGAVPLDEFRHERGIEYQRMVDDGTLAAYLVTPPTARFSRASQVLGMTLIIVGLILLTLVLIGFWQDVLGLTF